MDQYLHLLIPVPLKSLNIWGNSNQIDLNEIVLFHNKIIRIIIDSDNFDNLFRVHVL